MFGRKLQLPLGIHTAKCVGTYPSRDTYTVGDTTTPARVFLEMQDFGDVHYIPDIPFDLHRPGASSTICRAFNIPVQFVTEHNVGRLVVGRWAAIEYYIPSVGPRTVRMRPSARIRLVVPASDELPTPSPSASQGQP